MARVWMYGKTMLLLSSKKALLYRGNYGRCETAQLKAAKVTALTVSRLRAGRFPRRRSLSAWRPAREAADKSDAIAGWNTATSPSS